MKKTKQDDEWVKTTIRLPRALWHAARVRALEDRVDFQEFVAYALKLHIKRKEAQR